MAVKAQVLSVDALVTGSELSYYTFLAKVKFSDDSVDLGEQLFEEKVGKAPQAGQTMPITQGLVRKILQRRNELQASRNAVRNLVPEIKKGIESSL